MDNKIISTLMRKLGEKKVKSSDEYRITYSYDATARKVKPGVVVFPENEKDVEVCLKIAFENRIPVVPRGAGVGYTGGAVPVENSISLVFTKMNRIISLNQKSMTVEIEPGVVTYDLQKKCSESGLFYPPDPASLKTSTIGGNIAENAGGPRCFKYGVTGDYVLRIDGFLVNGTKVSFGSSSIKDVAGYNIKSLITGSEGTLIVITRILLRLIPSPLKNTLLKLSFKSIRQGAEFIESIMKLNLSPSVLEFMDRSSIIAVYEYLNMKTERIPGSIVIVEIDGDQVEIDSGIKKLRTFLKNLKDVSYEIAFSEKEKEKLWEIRRNISPAITKIKPKKINEDISVPVGMIPDTVEFINKISIETGIKILLFGHFGDGNIHTNIMIDPFDSSELRKSQDILDKIFKYVVSIGGTISGEHGIGLEKKKFLPLQYNNVEIDNVKKIKKVFDTDNLLNSGKIL